MKQVKWITLVFENCEVLRLTPNMFRWLCIEGISKRYRINAYQYKCGEVSESIDCEKFSIFINKEGLNQKTYEGNLAQDRLQRYRDITHIKLSFGEGEEEYITVPWKGGDYINESQILEETKNGLAITISLEKEV